MRLLSFKYHFVFFAMIFVLAACGTNSAPALDGAIVPTRAATSSPTATLIPSNTPTATLTLTPTETVIPSETPTFAPTATPTVPPVAIGEELSFAVNGSISTLDWQVEHTFTGNAGDSISIEMNTDSARLDPLLILLDENGTRLAENDDVNEDTDNAGILNFVLATDGNYTVIASRRGEDDSPYIGDYQLSFLRLPANYYDPATGIFLMPIDLNTDEIGAINDNEPFQSYIFEGDADAVISIEMSRASGNLDPYLILVNRQTQEIVAQNDDDERSETVNAYIGDVTLPQQGEYIILATRYQGIDGNSAGEFILRVSTP